MLNAAEVQEVVYQQIKDLLIEDLGEAPEITGKEPLHKLGVSSLMTARLIIQLEDEFGRDPFAEDVLLADVRSVDELIDVYRRALDVAHAA